MVFVPALPDTLAMDANELSLDSLPLLAYAVKYYPGFHNNIYIYIYMYLKLQSLTSLVIEGVTESVNIVRSSEQRNRNTYLYGAYRIHINFFLYCISSIIH